MREPRLVLRVQPIEEAIDEEPRQEEPSQQGVSILVIGSTGDAATPYEHAVRVARALAEGVLLTVDIDGHVAIGDSPCATEAATRYLVDLVPPAPGARC